MTITEEGGGEHGEASVLEQKLATALKWQLICGGLAFAACLYSAISNIARHRPGIAFVVGGLALLGLYFQWRAFRANRRAIDAARRAVLAGVRYRETP